MNYTVNKLAKLSGVTVRTLHFYDEIGLLKPARYGANGYRFYESYIGHSQLIVDSDLRMAYDAHHPRLAQFLAEGIKPVHPVVVGAHRSAPFTALQAGQAFQPQASTQFYWPAYLEAA